MNYPVWPDSGVSYPRTLLNSGSMRSLPPPPPPTGNGGTHGNSNGNDDGSKCPPKYATPGVVEQRAAAVAAAAAAAAAAASGSSGRLGEECAGARGQGSVSDKYAPLSSFTDDDSLLKVATHFLSGGGQGRHYVPLARDYSSLAYPGAGPPVSAYCNNPQQAPISLERPASRNPQSNQQQDGTAASRISSASSSDNGGAGAGGGAGGGGGGGANPLLSPCSVMEEASSPGSTTSQLSYLGALQSPASASLTPLGFPAPYLLTKDGTHVGLSHVVAGPKKKEGKPGSDVRSFGCQVCGRGFKQKATLAQHERTHTDERPFDCPDCHKRFRQQSHLVQHLRIHSDERPYSCTYCDKAFRQKAILNQHIRIHTGEKPYVCPQCTKCFRQKAILNQHIRTHSGKRPFSCPDAKCKKKFVDQASMEKHFKKHIEDDQQQLLAEARGGPTMPRLNAGRTNTKGLLRVKLSGSDRPAAFSRVVAPGAGGITTQDRATSPFPLTMMMRPPPTATPSDRMAESRAMASATDAMAAANGTDQISSNAATYLTHHGHHAHQPTQSVAAASAGPYQFVPFPHRPYPYDLLSLGPMGQSMYGNKMAEHQAQAAKYRDTLGETPHNASQNHLNELADPNGSSGGGNSGGGANASATGGSKEQCVAMSAGSYVANGKSEMGGP